MNESLLLFAVSDLGLRQVIVFASLVAATITYFIRRRSRRYRRNELRLEDVAAHTQDKSTEQVESGLDCQHRHDDTVERIGFMFNHREGTVPDRPFLTYRAVPMSEMLSERGMQLFMYSPCHVNLTTGRVVGSIIEDGRFRHIESDVPLVNGNWSLGIDRSINPIATNREFETWAREHGVESFTCAEFIRFAKDKYRAAELLESIAPGLHPRTELYKTTGKQLGPALERSRKVFLKPRRGNQGNEILVVERGEHGLILSHYKNKKRHQSTAPTLADLIGQLKKIIGDVEYVIQDGIDVEREGDSAFIFRVIMLDDGHEWQMITKAVVATNAGDVANTTQGGANVVVDELLEKLYGTEVARRIQDKLHTVSFETTAQLDSIYPGQLMEIAYDFVLDTDHEIRLVELNTMPGMIKPQMPKTNAFIDILNRSPSEQVIYERCLVPHARHLVNFLCDRHAARQASEPSPIQSKPIQVAKSGGSHTRVVFVGDTSFGESYQEYCTKHGIENILETRGYDHALIPLRPMLEAADLVIVNLETPLTDILVSPLAGQKRYIHWSDPTLAPEVLAAHNIGAVSLANNHAFDYGNEGLEQTLQALNAKGIASFGAGSDRFAATVPLTCDVSVGSGSLRLIVLAGSNRTRERSYHQYADDQSGGVNGWTETSAVAQIQTCRRAEPDALIVAFPHWGANYAWRSPRQRRLGRAMIEAGADLVIGHGAHMMQEIERYRDHWIVYSLGNFVFNSPGRYQKIKGAIPYSLVASLDVDPRGKLLLSLHPILSDNRITDYQPRPLTAIEALSGFDRLFERSGGDLENLVTIDEDELGHCLRLDLDPVRRPIAHAAPSPLSCRAYSR